MEDCLIFVGKNARLMLIKLINTSLEHKHESDSDSIQAQLRAVGSLDCCEGRGRDPREGTGQRGKGKGELREGKRGGEGCTIFLENNVGNRST